MILCSPSEPRYIKDALSAVSTDSIERKHGCDYMFSFGEGEGAVEVAIQRKTLGPGGDFIPSLYSGLMAKELTKMQSIPIRFLIIESISGLRWTNSGDMIQPYSTGKPFNRDQLWLTLWSLRSGYGLESVEWTLSEKDTVTWILAKQKWFDREKGGGSIKAKKPKEMDWLRFILGQFPGLGYNRVDDIMKILVKPLRWDETEAKLEDVPGIGKGLASKLRGYLEPLSGKGGSDGK